MTFSNKSGYYNQLQNNVDDMYQELLNTSKEDADPSDSRPTQRVGGAGLRDEAMHDFRSLDGWWSIVTRDMTASSDISFLPELTIFEAT